MQSAVQTRRKNIDKQSEHTNNDPDMELFTLSSKQFAYYCQNNDNLLHWMKSLFLFQGRTISDGTTKTDENEKQSKEQEESDNDLTELLQTQDGQSPVNITPLMMQMQIHVQQSSNAFDNNQRWTLCILKGIESHMDPMVP